MVPNKGGAEELGVGVDLHVHCVAAVSTLNHSKDYTLTMGYRSDQQPT